MALKIQRIIPGKIRGGRFIPNPKKAVNATRLGSGKRFEKCVAEVTARGGAESPKAVCAGAGIRKYGKKRMSAMAKKGRARKGHK